MLTKRDRHHDSSTRQARSGLLALAAAAAPFVLLAPTAHARTGGVVWSGPTRADNSHLTAALGKKLQLSLTASAPANHTLVVIEPVGGLPKGAVMTTLPGAGTTRVTLSWTPAQ